MRRDDNGGARDTYVSQVPGMLFFNTFFFVLIMFIYN